jgi:putative ABC transport system permease protein
LIGFLSRLIKGLRQDLRSTELLWLIVALTLSVTALSSVSFLADRMQRTFAFDARQLLASDLLIASDQPLPVIFVAEAKKRNLQIANTIVFPSMASSGTQSKLSSLKAVSASYPLRGTLELSSPSQQPSKSGPPTGSVWVDPAMLTSLQTQVGSQIKLGNSHFVIAGVLTRELDRGAGFMNFAPRVMMSLEDLPSTGLIGLGSRVTYRLLLAGSDVDIQAYDGWASSVIETQGLKGVRIETLENAQPIMRKTLDRAERFLSLIALLTAMVAAVAIALSSRRYVIKQADACAVLKCLGASSFSILKKQLSTLLGLGMIAAVLGSSLGFLVQQLLLLSLDNLVMGNLQTVSIWPVLWSVALSCFLLMGFALPPLLGLVKVSPVRLIRKEYARLPQIAIWIALFGLGSCLALIAIAARDWKLALWTALSFGAAVALFSLISWLLLYLLSRIHTRYFVLRFVLLAQGRRVTYAVVQITALGIAIMALLMILLLRQDLLSAWQGNIPVNAPNRFMINVQENQKQGIDELLSKAGVAKPEFYPMVRGRLVEINQQSITQDTYQEENARRLVDREFNLSYTNELPSGNRIISGKWLEGGTPQISLELGIAKTLKLKLGDELSFEVAGEKITAPITSLRKLDWGSMRVNFFVIMPPSLLKQMPQSWITSYYQASDFDNLDFRLSQAYPNLTVVDVSASLQQIQDVLNKLTAALSLLFAFTVIAAILVLSAAISATQDERFRNAALLKALGASLEVLSRIANIELLIIGAVAGSLAGIAAGISVWALGRYVLEIEFYAISQALFMGIGFGIVSCLLAGYRFQKKIQNATAIECLRAS